MATARMASLCGAACGLLYRLVPLAAQDDLRDVVTLTSGQQVEGRVLARFEPDEVLVVQGGKRVRLARDRVAGMDTVRDRLQEAFLRHDRLPDHPRHRWFLVQWADARSLHDLARLLAMDIVLHEPDHTEARAFLGHKQIAGEWHWPRGDQWFTRTELERFTADWGHPLFLESEHYRLRTDAGLRRAVDTLLDLERLHLFWFAEFGPTLRLREVVGPKLMVEVWAHVGQFPAWSSLGHPYFRPRTEAPTNTEATSSTYFEAQSAARATRLFEVVTQHLLYRTLADDPPFATVKERLAAWAEVGLGQYVERRMGGAGGRAAVGAWTPRADEVQLALVEPRYGLQQLIHRQARQYYVIVADNTPQDWAMAHLFVAWLLDGGLRPELRGAFLAMLVEALREGKGVSSSRFDRLLGRPVESLEPAWRAWMASL
jgi:hypothetical protein